jgi:hypothetical protein
MKQAVESFRNSQNALLTALNGHDSDAIFQASRDLSKAATQLGAVNKEQVDHSLLPLVSEVDELMQASIYRLRFLRDHSSTRLELLSGWQQHNASTYSAAARR